MAKSKKLEIQCSSSIDLDLDSLLPTQGNLKELSKDSFRKFRLQLLENGFSEPFSVWQNGDRNNILNGHQRLRVLLKMREIGDDIPQKYPCSLIFADDIHAARKKLLALATQYGEVTSQGLYEFMIDSDLSMDDMKNLRLPEVNMDKFQEEFFVDLTEAVENVSIKEIHDTEQWIVSVNCKDEHDMAQVYEEMKDKGYDCKLIT